MAAIIRTCAREIIANMLMGIPAIARRRIAAGRTSAPPTPENARHAFSIILDNPVIQSRIRGARIAEIGPGDHIATGLALLAYGAESYTAIDRFTGDYDNATARAWYALVRAEWSAHFATPFPSGLDGFPNIARVRVIRSGIENAGQLPEGAFDLVISNAVGEHVQDIDAFALSTHRLLTREGAALHNIDFSSHGLFGDDDTFLKIPDPIWHLMGSNRGLPNRKRVDDFVRAFDAFEISVIPRSARSAGFMLRKKK